MSPPPPAKAVAILRWTAPTMGALGVVALFYAMRADGPVDDLLTNCALVFALFGIPTFVAAVAASRIERKTATDQAADA